MSMSIRCPRCDSAFAVTDTRPSAEVRCDACGTLLGHVAASDARVDQPIAVRVVSPLRGFAGEVECAAFALNGNLLAAGLRISGQHLQLFDMATGRVRAVLDRQEPQVASVLFSRCGRRLVSGGT